MGHVLLYEINTRCWLRELSTSANRAVTLSEVPESELEQWSSAGFTHIWLMGVWCAGPKALQAARSSKGLTQCCAEILDRCEPEDIGASPYAISGYNVALEFGGEEGLQTFRGKLHKFGLKLILDFIPNHIGLDHPWLEKRCELVVPGASTRPGCFPVLFNGAQTWLAHGRDPYFPAWDDTAQLDYRVTATRVAMTAELMSVAERCDGVRCDMSMLLLKKVFSATWSECPRPGEVWEEEFWASAIRTVRATWRGFSFLAEVYWGLESELCALGFDYTYDKELYDHLLSGDAAAVRRHLYAKSDAALECGAYFLENHDERRVASALPPREHRAAALLILCLPGLTLLHEGQLSGRKLRVPVQFRRRPDELPDPAVSAIYDELLPLLKRSRVGRGTCKLLKPEPLGGQACAGVIVILWADAEGSDLIAVNLGDEACHFSIRLERNADRQVTALLAPPEGWFNLKRPDSLEFEMPRCGCAILSFADPAA